MQTLTTLQITDAFVEKITAIEPTLYQLRECRWAFTPSQHKQVGGGAELAAATRNFDLVFGAAVPSYTAQPEASWVGGVGTAYIVQMSVATSYAGVSSDILAHMLTQDSVDLRRALWMLRDPTLPGLVNVEGLGIVNARVDSEANVYVEHRFQIHYHQATA